MAANSLTALIQLKDCLAMKLDALMVEHASCNSRMNSLHEKYVSDCLSIENTYESLKATQVGGFYFNKYENLNKYERQVKEQYRIEFNQLNAILTQYMQQAEQLQQQIKSLNILISKKQAEFVKKEVLIEQRLIDDSYCKRNSS